MIIHPKEIIALAENFPTNWNLLASDWNFLAQHKQHPLSKAYLFHDHVIGLLQNDILPHITFPLRLNHEINN